MPEVHAKRNSASASHRWLNCPPSSALNERLTALMGEDTSPFAAEGTKAHSLAELKLRCENGELNKFNRDAQIKLLGEIPSEMDRATDEYVDVVMEKLYAAKQATPDAVLLIEQRLDFSPWAVGGFGTGDAAIISDTVLEVCDLKYGKGIPVSAEENPQARLYGLGAYNLLSDLYSFKTVRNTIIQPRLDSVSTEELSVEDLLAWGETVRPLAELSAAGEGAFKSGEWCRWCKAKAICRERVTAALAVFDSNAFRTPSTIPDSVLPDILKLADTAEQWLKDIKAYAHAQACNGATIQGYKLVRGRTPGRKWMNEDCVADQLRRAGYTTEQMYTEPELKSVSAMEKSIGKTAFKALLEGYYFTPEGALSLVPESDKRESVLADDFADLGELRKE